MLTNSDPKIVMCVTDLSERYIVHISGKGVSFLIKKNDVFSALDIASKASQSGYRAKMKRVFSDRNTCNG